MEPTPCLKLFNDDEDFSDLDEGDEALGLATLNFDYVGIKVNPLDEKEEFSKITKIGTKTIVRNRDFESKILKRLDDLGLIADEFETEIDGLLLEPAHIKDTWFNFMVHHRATLESEGWIINVDKDFSYQFEVAEKWYANITDESSDWFKLELGIESDGIQTNLLPFLVDFLSTYLADNETAKVQALPDDHPLLYQQDSERILNIAFYKVRHIIDTLIELNDPDALDQDGKLKLSRFQSNQLALLDSEHSKIEWTGGEKIREFGDKLQNFEGIAEIKPPVGLKAELRHYQVDGLSWLQFLREYKLGGILADDMGLGKTVQTLAHLLIEKKENRADLPSLVIAPTSLMVNWRREAERFAPELKLLVLHGTGRKKLFGQIKNHDLILTTYPLLTRDADVLLQQQWHVTVLDEAQHIKNPKAKAAQTACQLKARHRLCLTGTPMENHLGELWSQFNFLMPDMLSDEKTFQKLYRIPIEKQQDESRKKQLRNRLAPFMLRRDKSEVATELPPKTEILSEVELEGAQRDLYEKIRLSMHEKVKQSVDSKGLSRSHIVILDALLKLRQVCCHPQLIKNSDLKLPKTSAKLNQLMEMLPEMVEEGRRILLFSQFTSMLSIIEIELKKHKIEYVILTGQTRNREKPVDEFQSGKIPIFLISLKAGGSGLNLTAADTVIHYDPWWNPAVERQATDRAHRIGQDKPVFVYKMITAGTVEEKIIDMQNKKQALADSLFSEGQKASAISNEDLRSLFEPLTK